MDRLEQQTALEYWRTSVHSLGWIAVPIEGTSMQKINLWGFYLIGHSLRQFTTTPFSSFKDVINPLFIMHNAQGAVQALCDSDVQLSDTTIKAAKRLIDLLETGKNSIAESENFIFNAQTPKEKVESFGPLRDFTKAQEQAKSFEIIIANEFEGCSVFSISQKGTHQTALLLESAVNNLSGTIKGRLSQDAIDDVNEAGKCIALDAPTAAAFHILRAVESLMRDYHVKLTSNPLKVQSRNWGTFIKSLGRNGADQKVIGFLTHIKDHYRNPIVHPESTLNSDEAFALFNASLSAITMLDAAINTP